MLPYVPYMDPMGMVIAIVWRYDSMEITIVVGYEKLIQMVTPTNSAYDGDEFENINNIGFFGNMEI